MWIEIAVALRRARLAPPLPCYSPNWLQAEVIPAFGKSTPPYPHPPEWYHPP